MVYRFVRAALLAGFFALASCGEAPSSETMGEPVEAAPEDFASDDAGMDVSEPAVDASAGPFDPDDILVGNPPRAGLPSVVASARPSVVRSRRKRMCAVTGKRETVADCAAFTEDMEGLRGGFAAYQPQRSMVRDQQATVTYALSVAASAAQAGGGELVRDPANAAAAGAIAQATDDARAGATTDRSSETRLEQIKVSRFMFACLRGENFKIEPQECMTRDTVADRNVAWQWQVTPIRAGTQKLFLSSGMELRDEQDNPQRIGVDAPVKEIEVTVSTFGRFKDAVNSLTEWVKTPMGLIAALTALVGALGGLWAAIRKARGGTPAARGPAETGDGEVAPHGDAGGDDTGGGDAGGGDGGGGD